MALVMFLVALIDVFIGFFFCTQNIKHSDGATGGVNIYILYVYVFYTIRKHARHSLSNRPPS